MHDRERRGPDAGRTGRLPALSLVLALIAVMALAAACGQDDDDDRAGTAPSVPAEAELLALTGGTTTLTLDDGTAADLSAAGIAVEPAGAATAAGDAIALPITRGAVRPDTFRGAIRHRDAGVAFVADGERVDLTGLIVSTGDGFVASNDLGRTIGSLELSDLVAERGEDAVSATGITVSLGDQTAELLNERLGTDVFTGDTRLGSLTIEARTAAAGD